jgi:putative molybdopterin biosynthesis protein
VVLPLRADTVSRAGFSPAGGLTAQPQSAQSQSAQSQSAQSQSAQSKSQSGRTASPRQARTAAGGPGTSPADATATIAVRPIGPPRPTLVVAGCDPALPLLETPLALLDPPISFAWWPCGTAEALRLAAAGLVHAAGVHPGCQPSEAGIPGGAEVVGFASWREGLVIRPGTDISGLDDVARKRLRLVNREPGAQARTLLDAERDRLGLDPAELPGWESMAAGHLQVASAVAGSLADAGVSSEPAALAYGLAFIPLATERFDLVLPAKHAASREVQGLLKVLSSPWLLAQLAGLPGYDPSSCGERLRTA